MAKEIIWERYEIGKGLGQNLQEILQPIELSMQKNTFGLGFQTTVKDKREMQAYKRVEKEGKQIVMNFLPLHYTFSRPSGIILFELEEKILIAEIEKSLS